MLKRLWKGILAAAGLVVVVWIASPVPELTIIFSFVSGKSIGTYTGIPGWLSWAFAGIGGVIGWYVGRELGLLSKVKNVISRS